jgi:hypothetical protein
MDPLIAAIVEAGFTAIKAIIAQVEESKMADAQKKQAILARLQATQSALDIAQADANAELNKIKNS